MEVVITALSVPELEAIREGRGAGADLERWLREGSHCEVSGVEPTERGLERVFDAARALATREGLALQEVEVVERFEPVDEDRLVLRTTPADRTALPMLERIARQSAVCAILYDREAGSPPVALFHGRGVPIFGPVAPCVLEDLQATWSALAGGAGDAGRNLLQEQPEAWDSGLEEELTRRLRNLYGE